jgi:hypothetical protein
MRMIHDSPILMAVPIISLCLIAISTGQIFNITFLRMIPTYGFEHETFILIKHSIISSLTSIHPIISIIPNLCVILGIFIYSIYDLNFIKFIFYFKNTSWITYLYSF